MKNKIKQIRLEELVYQKILILKTEKKLSTFNEVIDFLTKDYETKFEQFLNNENHKIVVKEVNEIQKKIDNIEEFLRKDKASLRKWLGAFEKDYFVPFKKKIFETDRQKNNNFLNNPANFGLIEDMENLKKQVEIYKAKNKDLIDYNQKVEKENYNLSTKNQKIEDDLNYFKNVFKTKTIRKNNKLYLDIDQYEFDMLNARIKEKH